MKLIHESRTAGLVLFKHTIRLHKRFGTDTAFQTGNIKDAVERGRNYFGKGTSSDDDKALQGMSRTALNQVTSVGNSSNKSESKAKAEPRVSRVSDFDAVSEELYLASARYTTKGVKITESFEGHEAAERAQKALKPDFTVLQSDEDENSNSSTEGLGNHELFELGSPSGALVGFSVRGQLQNAVMKLSLGPTWINIYQHGPTKKCRFAHVSIMFRIKKSPNCALEEGEHEIWAIGFAHKDH